MRRPRNLVALLMLAAVCYPVCAGEIEGGRKEQIEAPSPDGQFAFRYMGESDSGKQMYDLIDKRSGKVLTSVAASDPDLGSSARFHMAVLWRPDSKVFALTATLWKRGSNLLVYVRTRSSFREIKLPQLGADIPAKAKRGKSFPHVVEMNSQRAKKWQKDGSLVVEIESIDDGNDGSVTATRTVVLGLQRSGHAKIVKSTIKFATEKP